MTWLHVESINYPSTEGSPLYELHPCHMLVVCFFPQLEWPAAAYGAKRLDHLYRTQCATHDFAAAA